MCEVERLLNESGQDAGSRYASAQGLMDGLRSGQAAFEYLDIAIIRYAERLASLRQNETASKLLHELQQHEHNEVAKLYIAQFFRHRAEISERLTP